jgi:hypothetical protein
MKKLAAEFFGTFSLEMALERDPMNQQSLSSLREIVERGLPAARVFHPELRAQVCGEPLHLPTGAPLQTGDFS